MVVIFSYKSVNQKYLYNTQHQTILQQVAYSTGDGLRIAAAG